MKIRNALKKDVSEIIELTGLLGYSVDERYRGRGIGKQLVEQAGKWAVEKGYKNLIVGSSTKRTESHLFYQGIGFEYWKEQKLYSKKI